MNEKPLVSIVLPVYNGAEHVQKAIDSVLAQTYADFELIAVDDCSTDNTLEILKANAKRDSRIKVLSNETNLKLPRTLNAGFAVAGGKYLTWTSDDNKYKPNALEAMVGALEADASADMVYADFTNIDADDNVIGEMSLAEPDALVAWNCCGACFLYTKRIAEHVGPYDADLFLAEDYDYWMRIYAVGRVVHLPEDLYCYRRHAQSLSETRKAQINVQTLKAIEKNLDSMLASAKANGKENLLFDHMLSRVDEGNRGAMYKRICALSPTYPKHVRQLKRQALKDKIRKTPVGRILVKIKRAIRPL